LVETILFFSTVVGTALKLAIHMPVKNHMQKERCTEWERQNQLLNGSGFNPTGRAVFVRRIDLVHQKCTIY